MAFLKIQKYSFLWGAEIIWMLIPSFKWCLKDKLCQRCLQAGELNLRNKHVYMPVWCLSWEGAGVMKKGEKGQPPVQMLEMHHG